MSDIRNAILAVPAYEMDKIIRSRANTTSHTNSIGGYYTELNTPFSEPMLTLGIYSFDGGETWQDFAPFLSSASPTSFQSDIKTLDDGSLAFSENQTALIGGGATFDLIRKYIYMVHPDNIEPPDNAYSFVEGTSYTTKNTYMKIAHQDSKDFASAGTHTVTHGLGYRPMLHAWVYSDGVMGRFIHSFNAFDTASTEEYIDVGTNDITFRLGAFTTYPATLYYRIYHEGA